jgi:hypothetical protein
LLSKQQLEQLASKEPEPVAIAEERILETIEKEEDDQVSILPSV